MHYQSVLTRRLNFAEPITLLARWGYTCTSFWGYEVLVSKSMPIIDIDNCPYITLFCKLRVLNLLRIPFCVYKTYKGYRLLVQTNNNVLPNTMLGSWLLIFFGTDTDYNLLCREHNTWRARISPKPWRKGLGLSVLNKSKNFQHSEIVLVHNRLIKS
jgi:hypothetical protein